MKIYFKENYKINFLIFCSIYTIITLPLSDYFYTSLPAAISIILSFYFISMKDIKQNYIYAVLLVAILIAINIATSTLPKKSATGSFALIRALILFLPGVAIATLNSKKESTAWLTFACASICLFITLIAIFQINPDQQLWLSLYNYSEINLGNAHNLINITAITLIGLSAVILKSKNRLYRSISIPCFISMALLCVVLQSEGTFLALGITFLAYIAIHTKKTVSLASIVAIIATILLLQTLYIFPEFYKNTISISLGSFEARKEIYVSLLNHLSDNLFFGYGINTYKYIEAAQPISTLGYSFFYPHQIYLESLFSTGIFGCILLAGIFYTLARKTSLSAIKKSPLTLAAFLIIVYLLAKGLTDMKMFAPYPLGIIALCLGIINKPLYTAEENHDSRSKKCRCQHCYDLG